MSAPQLPNKSCISVSEMAEACQLSRSRFYDLIEAGVFPKPTLHPVTKRPLYDHGLIEKCLEIRRTGIGANGLPVLFNRRGRKSTPDKTPPKAKVTRTPTPDHGELIDALKGLGLTTTAQAVDEAVAALYPDGLRGVDLGDVVRKVFLHLQGRRS